MTLETLGIRSSMLALVGLLAMALTTSGCPYEGHYDGAYRCRDGECWSCSEWDVYSDGYCEDGDYCWVDDGECSRDGEDPCDVMVRDPENLPECDTRDDCEADGAICVFDHCMAFCEADEECPDGQLCDTGLCRIDGEDPGADGDADADADADADTDADGDADVACTFNADCEEDEACYDGACRTACAEDGSCADGFDCTYGLCVPTPEPETPETCVRSDECLDGQVCLDGACAELCTTQEDCGDDLVCDRGICKEEADPQDDPPPTTECVVSTDCAEGQQCLDGSCRTPCWTECDCDYRAGEVCESGYCVSGE